MIDNPFIISGKIDRRYFCDRVHETEELIRLIRNGHNVVLISERRMGKTGLIDFCFEDPGIKENYFTFFIDILQTNTFSEFIFLLGKEIFRVLAPRSRKLATGFVQALKSLSGKIGFDSVSGMPSINISLGDIKQPEITLDEIFDYLDKAQLRCIVAVDEFQQIASYPQKNIEAMLRSRIQRTSNCNFIFSGSQRHVLQEMFINYGRPFYQSASFMNLERIPREIYVDFICRLFKEYDKSIPVALAQKIYELYQGHTYYVQRTCNEVFYNTAPHSSCDRATLDSSVAHILDTYSSVFQEILSQISIKQKELLYAIAKEGRSMAITSAEFIQRHSLASASSVQSSARMLLHRDILTRKANEYYISDRFFEMWIRRMLS